MEYKIMCVLRHYGPRGESSFSDPLTSVMVAAATPHLLASVLCVCRTVVCSRRTSSLAIPARNRLFIFPTNYNSTHIHTRARARSNYIQNIGCPPLT